MKIFITTRSHSVNHKDIVITDSLLPLLFFLEDVKNSSTPILGYDKEFNGLNELNAIPLITQIGNSEHQFAVDDISFPSLSYLEPYKDLLYVGHFIKIDVKISRLQGVDLRNVYDTGITEQRLGLDSKRKNDLEAVHERRLGVRMPFKDFGGKTFSTMNKSSIYENSHILYSLGDIVPLLEIKEKQKYYIEKYGMHDLIRNEKRIIPIISDGELEGMNINEPRWLENIVSNKKKLIEVERKMDKLLEDLTLVPRKRERQSGEIVQTNLFGFQQEVRKIPIKSRINYSSSDQVLELFDKLGYEKPTELDDNYEPKPSAGGPALQQFNLENPENELFDFIEALLEYKEIDKELSSFGDKFLYSRILKKDGKHSIGYKNDKTGRVHTIYRQVETKTGRLASGESKVGYYNSQQVPAIPKYRTCFTLSEKELNGRTNENIEGIDYEDDDEWWITTSDLTGAEVTIMCAFAKDKQLYKWAIEEDDLHSPLATACWKEIARQRVMKNQSLSIKDTRGGVHILDPDMVINKNKDNPYTALRTDYKNGGTFGMVYGAKANTVSSYFNIYKHEGQLMIDTIKSLIPDTFTMVEEAAKFAIKERYLIFNTRTNSRKWFLPYQKEALSKSQKTAIEGEARNAKMQGSQADMIKEAIWEIDQFFREKQVENKMLLTIHDELVWKHRGKKWGKDVARIMGEVGTKYLEGFTVMKAHADTGLTWTK